MPSHTYDFNAADVGRILAAPLIAAAVFAAAMHGGGALDLLPSPRPTLDIDRTIMIHQAEASHSPSDAEVLLAGDSSCLMDVSVAQLSNRLGRPALNLGTLSFLDLNHHAAMVRDFVATHPDQVKVVVLLMHPEALRRPAGGTYHGEFLRHFVEGKDFVRAANIREQISHMCGLEIFRSRILARVVPVPLSGVYGKHYGFASDLEEFMESNHGSLVEVDQRPFQGLPEYWLTGQLEQSSAAFRSAVPAGARLVVGITPVPENYVGLDYTAVWRVMLEQWARWLAADKTLWDLPPTMPDKFFARTTHLDKEGARFFTDHLARVLEDGEK